MRYVPEADTTSVPHVVVDGSATESTVLTISHWPATPVPEHLWADTSAEMVLRYVDAGADLHGDAEVATNNHFDQDGAAGLFVLTDPEGALPRRELVADLSRAGDFATYRHREAARVSMALASLAAATPPAPYPEQCAAMYTEALGMLPELFDHPDRFRRLWEEEDAELEAGEAAVAAGLVDVRELRPLDLAVITVDRSVAFGGGHRFATRRVDGLHPMALHALTPCTRLLVLHGDDYRYTDRYETWVQYRSRRVPRRVDLRPLADALTASDDGVEWEATPPGELTPTLAPAGDATSSLGPAQVESAVISYLETAEPAFDPYAVPVPSTQVAQ